jgi:hypothetical protein
MRKNSKNTRSTAPRSSTKQVLKLSRETVRTLTSEQLSRVVQAAEVICPTGSDTTTTTKKTTLR